ncbi:hypothetical protein MGAST_22960 [Mycobacterium gastri 'Wayne']|nr:hypothetical protein MGAST_22960 [Mycobacterium gastri 'Wayne']
MSASLDNTSTKASAEGREAAGLSATAVDVVGSTDGTADVADSCREHPASPVADTMATTLAAMQALQRWRCIQ